MNALLDIPLSPVDWPSPVFVALIVLAIVLRFLLPWKTRRSVRVLREVLIILPAALLYFLVRGLVGSDGATAIRHGEQIIQIEKWLGIWWERELQEMILGSAWRVDLVNWVYIWGHWPVIALVMTWLVLRHFDDYPVYRNALLISGVVGMIIFATYPVAPPRLMPGYELVDTVTVRSSSYRVLQPPALTNPYAAMPSLHFGWNLLMGIALVRESSKRPAQIIGFIVPIAMFSAIVLSANHYILDAVAGGAIVLSSLAAATFLARSGARVGSQAALDAPIATGASEGHDGAASILDVLDSSPFVVAHRSGNTLDGLRQASQAGADVIEADVWPYRGRLEVRHTKTLGPLPVLWDRWLLEPGWKPRLQLDDLLQAVDDQTLLMLDVKGRDPAAPGQIIETLRVHLPGRPVLICSQNWDQIDRFKPYPDAVRVYSIGNRWQLRRAWSRLDAEQWDAVSIQARLLDRSIVEALKTKTAILMTWPINSRERFDQVISWGADGVTTDNLDLILDLRPGDKTLARKDLARFDTT
ncbi:MAG: phosphatase PAP2 family protein [Thermomicrobiales bacterium]